MEIGIVGTGISGLSVAQMLRKENDVTLFENKYSHGGLIKCERVNDNLFHKVGGHVFNSRNQKVLDWFWSFFNREEEFVTAKRNAKIFFRNRIIGYPIENYIYSLDETLAAKIINELFSLQNLPAKNPYEYDSFESFLINNFGKSLFEIYFKPYNFKIWQTDLKLVAMEWLEGKLPMPDFKEIILSNILRRAEESMVHSTFFYPKENGSQFIIDRLSADLEIVNNYTISNINFKENKIILNYSYECDALVYTGDIRNLPIELNELLADNGVDMDYIKSLRSNGTSNLFCETDDTDTSWLYIPEEFTKAHRIIYTGNFSETNNRGSLRKTCVVEFSGNVSNEVMIEEIKKLPGNLFPLACNFEKDSYVVQDSRTRSEINKIKSILESRNVYLLGRFAEWEYYNMDKAIETAMAVSDKLVKRA